ncbi:MAG: hypothetical protein JXP34_03560, partial [Planctomycetes bacterium]|nr:hypothetical protein [Planctomycetota bacterium]
MLPALVRTLPLIPAIVLVADPRAAAAPSEDGLRWHDILSIPSTPSTPSFGIEGKGWTDTKAPFDRLPAKAEGVVRAPVWDLSHHSAGMCVRFVTDATAIHARWT